MTQSHKVSWRSQIIMSEFFCYKILQKFEDVRQFFEMFFHENEI